MSEEIDIAAMLGDDARPVIDINGPSAMGAFEAADRTNNALSLWSPPMRSADGDILPDKRTLDLRARDMLRNDAYVQGGSTLHKDNIVGAHFLPNARPATRVLWGKYDDVWEEEFQAETEELFELYCESPENWIDASRTSTLTGLVRLAVGINLAAGETLSVAEFDRERGGGFATMIQMIDLDRLDTAPNSRNDPNVRRGVRYDSRGAPIAYQIRTEHPSDWVFSHGNRDNQFKEIPTRKPWGRLQVIHLLEQMRPDQSRGISEMASALKAMKISHKLRDLNLQRIATQATYAAAITSELPTDQVFAALGGVTDAESIEEGISKFGLGYLGAISQYTGNARNLNIDGAKIPHLYPGTKLELLSPGKDTVNGSEFEQSVLRYIAASIGVSYEQLSRDYTNTNYSSARAAMSETWKFMQARKKLIADRFGSAAWRLWLEEGINNNAFSTMPKRKAGMLYTGGRLNLKFEALSRVEWIGASRGQIDELKETEAAVLRIEAGLSTAEDELARLGKDWRKVYRQQRRERELRDELGIPHPAARQGGGSSAAAPEPAQEKKKVAA